MQRNEFLYICIENLLHKSTFNLFFFAWQRSKNTFADAEKALQIQRKKKEKMIDFENTLVEAAIP